MELQWDLRPVSMVHRPQDWNEHPENGFGTSSASSSYYSRRSTVAPVAPPGPPPSHPIPNLPLGSSSPPPPHEHFEEARLSSVQLPALNGSVPPYNAYSRPAASPSLAAVAAFSQGRTAPSLNHPRPTLSLAASSSAYNLSDSPPRSQLRPAMEPQHQDIMPDRLLLSPTEPPPNEKRPSSRRALTRALELAREAVRLDSTNDDPYAAIAAYGRSVSLLSEVMDRVMRGEDTTESHKRRNGRRRSVIAQEEEVRRLRSIHDTYAERMNILSLIYNIPVDLHSPSSVYPSMPTSADSTQPSSPDSLSGSDNLRSTSPTEDLSGDIKTSSIRTMQRNGVQEDDGVEAIGSAMFNLNASGNSSGFESSSAATTPHATSSGTRLSTATTIPTVPYSQNVTNAGSSGRSRIASIPQVQNSQGGQVLLRPRALSALPPPPMNSLPPTPASIIEPLLESRSARPRGSSVSHKRTGSGNRLRPLNEDVERREEGNRQFETGDELRRPRSKSVLAAQRHHNGSQPLPPLPSPDDRAASAITPRQARPGEQPMSSSSDQQNITTLRPRGDSIASEATVPPNVPSPVINSSPINGTISLRRGKTSAPPSIQGSPNLESASSAPTLSRLTGSLQATAASSLGMGRTRASSQPGRRPSLVSLNTYPLPAQPTPLGQSTAQGSRKVSVPSKLNPNAPPQITINTVQLSPPTATMATMLVPPPPIPPEHLPSAPLSPLPPAPPPDPLRKPYHMMNLLRHTMISKTGGYVTRRLHVPYEVWSQGGAKLSNIPEKIRVVEVLLSALEEVQNCSANIFGAGNVSSGLVLGIGSIGKREGEAWGSKLEEFSAVCDGLVSNFGKKLGVGEGFVTKKSGGFNAWGNRLTRQFDKLTTGKNLDSPTEYVHGLAKLFLQTQLLDEHTKALSSTPVAPTYAAFSVDLQTSLEVKLRHASEFFARVVLTFVIRDLSQLLDKYVKKCEKWLAE